MEELNIKSQKVKTHYMRKVLPIYAKQKKMVTILMFVMVVCGVLGILQPIYSANALASLASEKFKDATKFIIIMCALGLGRIVFNLIMESLYIRVNAKTKKELTEKLIWSINSTKMSTLDGTKLGSLSEKLSNDIGSVSDCYLDMMNLVFNILTNIVFLIYIAFLNFYLFLILMGYVLLLFGVCTIKSRIWIRGRKITKKANDEARSAYMEQISGMRDVKLLGIEESVTSYSGKKYDKALKLEVSVGDKRNFIRRTQGAISIVFELVFLLIGIVFIKREMILLTGLLIIYSYYGRVEGLVNFLSSFKEFSAEGEIAASRIFDVIENYEKENFGTENLENFSGKIELKNTNFSYTGEKQVLKNANLCFEPGKMTAIVGKSGSGKSTILNLISKLYDVEDGQIFYDCKDINSLSKATIRNNVGEISQTPYIFNSTVRQNLLFSKPDATEQELKDVLKAAQIYDDVVNMPQFLDTEIGENGVKISGGQRQRLAIARLLLKDTKVIVFDEATSALDNSSQKKIVDLLETFKSQKTIIIVAHRLSTIINADTIYMVEDGSVIAGGTHRELMKKCKSYRELYKLEEQSATEKITKK